MPAVVIFGQFLMYAATPNASAQSQLSIDFSLKFSDFASSAPGYRTERLSTASLEQTPTALNLH